MRGADSDGLSDAAAEFVADEAGAVDAEEVQQDEHAVAVRFNVNRQCAWRVTSAIAEQVHDDHAASLGEERDQVLPEVGGGRESVNEYKWLTTAACAGRVVVQPSSANIEEFAAHVRPHLCFEDGNPRQEGAEAWREWVPVARDGILVRAVGQRQGYAMIMPRPNVLLKHILSVLGLLAGEMRRGGTNLMKNTSSPNAATTFL